MAARSGNATAPGVPSDGSWPLRALVSTVYLVVCAAGLLGNLLVLILVKGARGRHAAVNVFICNLAVTDLCFALTLPFWAADTILDFSWPFGHTMCKAVLSVTVMNMYASVFFLTATSVARYRSVASAPRPKAGTRWSAWAAGALWAGAASATAPAAVFSTVRRVAGERLCLLGFPEGGTWLALYHLQKILLAFVVPLGVVCACNLLLLRLLRARALAGAKRLRRRARVTRSVTVAVLSFFLCWMPNQAVTLWGVLVKFNLLQWDHAYYMAHTYAHPLSVCLAHANSCLNPLLYCLLRPDFRCRLKEMFRKVASPAGAGGSPGPAAARDANAVGIPLDNLGHAESC
ncbi:relaxin-3 receptor 1-like [Syngnathoides biaculeatus]|uniref:relaxin-3 receptor 1-like n=1 Tax=Syngnathoides biaculeatus TaxID=300417 RepID=UPI002ADDA5C2|nr:relaxin-3 receptor 1-like [Syngnathoides biaculeatus]